MSGRIMWFDGPNQILPIFHHLMWFDGPKKLMWFDGPKSSFSPFKTSCVLMDPKPHVVWWTLIRVFKVFPSQNLMCFDGPTTRLKPHVFWWTQNLMWFDGPLMIFRVHQITWGFWVHQNTGVHKKLMWFDGPMYSTSLGPSNHMRFLHQVAQFKKWTNTFLIQAMFLQCTKDIRNICIWGQIFRSD